MDASRNPELHDMTALVARVSYLEEQLALQTATTAAQTVRRRRTLQLLLTTLTCFIGVGALFGHFADSAGAVLQQFMDYSTPHVTPPPLDTAIRWQRRDAVGAPVGYTNEILSLIAEADQRNSYTWPLYIQLAGTTDPTADQLTSQSVGATVRAFNRSTGSPWLAGYHSELHHGVGSVGGPAINTRGTSILFNGELISKSANGATIGVNVQNTPESTVPGTHAINIQSGSTTAGWQNGLHFDGVGTAGNIGVNFDTAHYNLGLDLADNSMRLNAGQKIYLEKFNQVYLWYNPQVARIQLIKSGIVVASW